MKEQENVETVTHTHTHTSTFKRLISILGEFAFSSIFSIALVLMWKIRFFGMVYDNNYIENIFAKDFLILFILIPVFFAFIHFFIINYKNIYDYVISNNDKLNIKKFVIIACILISITYLIYYFSLFPGGIFIDTYTCFQMLVNEMGFTNQHPIIFTLSLNLVKIFRPNEQLGFAIYTLIQLILMVMTITYFIYWLIKRKVNPVVVSAIVFMFMFFKLYPLYSISVWKDTPFSLALFLYTLFLIDLIDDFKNKNIRIKNIILFNVFAALTMLFRNNGMLITFFPVILLLIINCKNIFNNLIKRQKIFIIVSIVTIIVSILFQNILTFILNVRDISDVLSCIAIPTNQIARVVATDGNITDSQKQLIEKVLPYENIKEDYAALIVDPIQSDKEFNHDYLREHLGEYFKLWFELLIQNPGEYIKSYLLQTSGFWTFNVVGEEAYVQDRVYPILLHKLTDIDYISKVTNEKISFKDKILNYNYYSGGFFFWIMAFSMLITWRIGEKKYLLAYIPELSLWLTVMIATPMGQALRYVYILVLMMPLNILLPIIFKK